MSAELAMHAPHDYDDDDVYVDQDCDRDRDQDEEKDQHKELGTNSGDTPFVNRYDWVAIIDQADDSMAIWASSSEVEFMSMQLHSGTDVGDSSFNTNFISRPQTPPWSQSQPWAANLENINTRCIDELNATFQSTSNKFDTVDFRIEEEDEFEDVYVTVDQNDLISLELLEQAFEQVRQRANAIIDETKAKAIAAIQEQIPTHLQRDAVSWYAKRLNVVMSFWEYIGNAMKKVTHLLMNGAKGAWISILRTLRIGIAKRAIVTAQGLRKLQSTTMARAITAGDERPSPAVYLR